MKKLVLFGFVIACMMSCGQSSDEKAQALIRKSMEKSLVHPESYEALNTVVDSAFAPFDDPAFFNKTLEICKINIEELNDSLTSAVWRHGQELLGLMGDEYRFIGFKVTHDYNAQDEEGETFTGEKVYIIDKDMKTILAEYDTDSLDYIMVQTMYTLWRDESASLIGNEFDVE